MNRFKTLLENDFIPATNQLNEAKNITLKIKIPISNYANRDELADVYAQRDTATAEKLAMKILKKKIKKPSIIKVEFQKLTKKEAVFNVTAKGE